MKILLRDFDDRQYIWCAAKYNGRKFVVDGSRVHESNIVSVLNDNRKNYLRCSSCGEIFPKNGKKFAKHQAEAKTINPCLKCRKMRATEMSAGTVKYVANGDGTYTRKNETIVNLHCHVHFWSAPLCESNEAIRDCVKRQCGDANGEEIHDTFTDYPGLFDDIITVDRIIDNGYEKINWSDNWATEYLIDSSIGLLAHVNRLSIVDRFVVNTYEYGATIWYSKKYDKFFAYGDNDNYELWSPDYLDEEKQTKIEATIRKMYK